MINPPPPVYPMPPPMRRGPLPPRPLPLLPEPGPVPPPMMIPPFPEDLPPRLVPVNNRGHIDESYLTPLQRVNRKKVQSGFYTHHDVVMTRYKYDSTNV